jgi:hypothetical protein
MIQPPCATVPMPLKKNSVWPPYHNVHISSPCKELHDRLHTASEFIHYGQFITKPPPHTPSQKDLPQLRLPLLVLYYSVNGAIYMISTEWRQNRYKWISICLLCTGVALYVSNFPRSSSGKSQEYETKFLNWVPLIWIHILQFVFFYSECTTVKCNLTMHTKTLVMYGFFLPKFKIV